MVNTFWAEVLQQGFYTILCVNYLPLSLVTTEIGDG